MSWGYPAQLTSAKCLELIYERIAVSTRDFEPDSLRFIGGSALYLLVFRVGSTRRFYLGSTITYSCGIGFDLRHLYLEKEKLGVGDFGSYCRRCSMDLLLDIIMAC